MAQYFQNKQADPLKLTIVKKKKHTEENTTVFCYFLADAKNRICLIMNENDPDTNALKEDEEVYLSNPHYIQDVVDSHTTWKTVEIFMKTDTTSIIKSKSKKRMKNVIR